MLSRHLSRLNTPLMLYICAGQTPTISPQRISGQVGDTVTFYCDSLLAGEGGTIVLDMYSLLDDVFISFDNSTGRLRRIDDNTLANFTLGPLRPDDNGIIVRCTTSSGQLLSGNATISVECKWCKCK